MWLSRSVTYISLAWAQTHSCMNKLLTDFMVCFSFFPLDIPRTLSCRDNYWLKGLRSTLNGIGHTGYRDQLRQISPWLVRLRPHMKRKQGSRVQTAWSYPDFHTAELQSRAFWAINPPHKDTQEARQSPLSYAKGSLGTSLHHIILPPYCHT